MMRVSWWGKWQRGCACCLRRLTEAYRELDAEQGDGPEGGGRICGGEFVWARPVGKFGGGGADGSVDCAGCAGRTYRADQEAGDAGGGADRYSGRPDDRERVLHLLCGGGNGVAVAAGMFPCARGGYGFSARDGHARWAFGLGSERDVADVVGTGTGGFTVEPGIVRGDEMLVLLLLGIGAGADARAGCVNRRVRRGCADCA